MVSTTRETISSDMIHTKHNIFERNDELNVFRMKVKKVPASELSVTDRGATWFGERKSSRINIFV